MSERDLNRAVAKICGEFVETIQGLGFRLIDNEDSDDLSPLVLDWDDRQPAYLGDVLSHDDWQGRVDPLPSYDEVFDDEEDYACAAA